MKLSVILPCYNVTPYLAECLNSIFKNDCRDTEIILVDDGSTDSIEAALNPYFGRNDCDADITFPYQNADVKILHQRNSGVSAARNTGLKNATGAYVLFVDPDDTVEQGYFAAIRQFCLLEDVDVIIQGFYQKEVDARGQVIETERVLPQKQYCTNAVEETVGDVLPKYLGYSVADVVRWSKSQEALSRQAEWGGVWRHVYRLQFLNDHGIRFNPALALNEDSMFNAVCFSWAEKVRTLPQVFYDYTIRPSGALRKKKGTELLDNRMELLKQRMRIVEDLQQRGFDFSLKDYAGANVLSCMELMVKLPFSARRRANQYFQNPVIRQSIEMMPFTGRKKWDLPLWMLKHRLGLVMLYGINLAKVLGVSTKL